LRSAEKTPVSVDDVVDTVPAVADHRFDLTTFNVNDYPVTKKLLFAYIEGAKTTVTYFQLMDRKSLNRDNVTDNVTNRDVTNSPYRKIKGFKIIVTDDFIQPSFNSESVSMDVTGEGMTLPGFEPRVNDLFYYDLHTGHLSVFKVTYVEPMTIHEDRLYRIKFSIRKFLDHEFKDFLAKAVVDERNFNESTYLAGNHVLLTNNEWRAYQILTQMREVITKYYYKTFMNRDLKTLFHPNGTYDPYVVKFMTTITEQSIAGVRPKQIYPDVENTYDYTIWARLLEEFNGIVSDLTTDWMEDTYMGRQYGGYYSSILNKAFVRVLPNLTDQEKSSIAALKQNYVFSQAFYSQDFPSMDGLEKHVYQMISKRELTDVDDFIDVHVNLYNSGTLEKQFYHIPAILCVIKFLLTTYAKQPLFQ